MYIHLAGRLGNQLFQWSYCHQLASTYGVKPKFVVNRKHHPNLLLDELIMKRIACNHIEETRKSSGIGWLLLILDKLAVNHQNFSRQLAKQLGILRVPNGSDVPIMPIKQPWLVTGFFINHTLVEEVEPLIIAELLETLKTISMPSKIIRIQADYQVMHIRRGDFRQHQETFGILSDNYYAGNREESLPLYICTDEPDSVAGLASRLQASKVVGPLDLNAWQTLKFMSGAKNLVMANSTLSWWAGFIAANCGSTVLLPDPFYKTSGSGEDFFKYRLFKTSKAQFV